MRNGLFWQMASHDLWHIRINQDTWFKLWKMVRCRVKLFYHKEINRRHINCTLSQTRAMIIVICVFIPKFFHFVMIRYFAFYLTSYIHTYISTHTCMYLHILCYRFLIYGTPSKKILIWTFRFTPGIHLSSSMLPVPSSLSTFRTYVCIFTIMFDLSRV